MAKGRRGGITSPSFRSRHGSAPVPSSSPGRVTGEAIGVGPCYVLMRRSVPAVAVLGVQIRAIDTIAHLEAHRTGHFCARPSLASERSKAEHHGAILVSRKSLCPESAA